ncbi:MAG: vitamin K epoxide reductase, partial [Bacteroidota bacterium]
MNAVAIRDALRDKQSDDLDRRRKIITLSAIGLLDFSIISLYQTGVIKKLPDFRLPIFDSNKVNASKEAYQFGV